MAKDSDSCFGLTLISESTSKCFLALRPLEGSEQLSNVQREYAHFLGLFDFLCNLNARDRVFANDGLTNLGDSKFAQSFPLVFKGLKAWGSGELHGARDAFVEHLARHSQDYVAFFMLHMFDFLHGKSDCYRNYLSADVRCEHEQFGGYYKGMLAFSLCEQGRADEGLPLALAACDRDDLDDIYSIHALVHCWHALGEHERIVDFLRSRRSQWETNPGMNMHVCWHLAISLLALGRTKESTEAYHQLRALSAGHHAEQDLDAVNYCVRRFFTSLPQPAFLQEFHSLARNWAPSIYNSLSYFNDAHAACAFLLAGDEALMRKLIDRPQIASLEPETKTAGQTILHAINSLMHDDYARCFEQLDTTRRDWHRIGGSYAQREIFDILAVAARAMATQRQVRYESI